MPTQKETIPWEVSLQHAQETARQLDKVVLIDFSAAPT